MPQPQELIQNLQDIQTATNKITLASAAVSSTTGDFIEFLGSGEDLANAPSYTEPLASCIKALTCALDEYVKAAVQLYRGGPHE